MYYFIYKNDFIYKNVYELGMGEKTKQKRMHQGKRFGSNGKVIPEIEAYFEAKDKSLYKKGIELFEKRWN